MQGLIIIIVGFIIGTFLYWLTRKSDPVFHPHLGVQVDEKAEYVDYIGKPLNSISIYYISRELTPGDVEYLEIDEIILEDPQISNKPLHCFWTSNKYGATAFKSQEQAINIAKDMVNNPSKYLFKE